jgi:hypothetical protein
MRLKVGDEVRTGVNGCIRVTAMRKPDIQDVCLRRWLWRTNADAHMEFACALLPGNSERTNPIFRAARQKMRPSDEEDKTVS